MSDGKTAPVPAAGETHLVNRQQTLRSRAEQLAGELSKHPDVQLVWLTGSVAKGLVDAASDVDLHVFSTTPLDLSPWRFAAQSAPENIHQFPLETLRDGISKLGDVQALGQWMAKSCLADALHGAVCLYRRPEARPIEDQVETLLTARRSDDIRLAVARTFAGYCADIADQARTALSSDAPLDAHQMLRRASQELLLSHLISRGWIVRGSKKRPEIANAYGLDQFEAEFMALFLVVNGLDALTNDGAIELCRQRQEYRASFAEYLRAIMVHEGEFVGSARAAVADYEEHNLGAENYYAPLLTAGMVKGPVNHIRSFSGFVNVPRAALAASGRRSNFPAAAWTSAATARDSDAVAGWLRISDLSASRELVADMISAIQQQAAAFGKA